MGSSVWSVQWKTPEVPANTGLESGGFYYRLEAMANGDPSSIWDAWRGQTKDTEVGPIVSLSLPPLSSLRLSFSS